MMTGKALWAGASYDGLTVDPTTFAVTMVYPPQPDTQGAKAAAAITSNAAWKAARPAQFSVPVAEMVERVREVLGRHF